MTHVAEIVRHEVPDGIDFPLRLGAGAVDPDLVCRIDAQEDQHLEDLIAFRTSTIQ